MASASFSMIRVLSSASGGWEPGAAPFQSLEYNPQDERTSYFISKGLGNGNSLLEITRGDFNKQDYKTPDLLAGLHIQSSGYVFLESLNPTQEVYFVRDPSKPFARKAKRLLPESTPPKERILVLLDFDARIFINDEIIEFKIGSLDSVPQKLGSRSLVKSLGLEGDVAGRDEDPHILVQQSYPQESLRRGDTDLAYLTPAAPEAVQEEPRVHETPSVKSRFMNPDSATVTLPKAPLREDTFGDPNEEDGPTPRVGGNGLRFSGRPGEILTSQLSAMDDVAMSASDEEGVERSSKFFMPTLVEANSIESTADEEAPTQTRKLTPTANGMAPISIATSPEEINEEKDNLASEAEGIRREFNEASMITPCAYAGSVRASDEVSPTTGDRKQKGGKYLDTPLKPMKQGIPEGFLYEEHKKETTPKQTYGKNKRGPRSKPKEKVEMDQIVQKAISDDELTHNGYDVMAEDKKERGIREISYTDESEEEKEVKDSEDISSRGRNRVIRAEEDDTVTETADEEEEEITFPARTQGRRGRKTVESQPNSTAATEVQLEPKSGKISRKTGTLAKKAQDNAELKIKETGAKSESMVKHTRSKRGAQKPVDVSETPFVTTGEVTPKAPPGKKPTRSTRKRQRTPESIDEDRESMDGEIGPYSIPTGTAESMIQVAEEPKSKRAKMTPLKKLGAKMPATKRGKKKDVTPSPLLEGSGKVLGDTQYTFTDITQTQTVDRVEVRTPIKTPKTAPKVVKKRTALTKKAGTTPSARKKADAQHELTEEDEVREDEDEDEKIDGPKARTRDRYEGDNPKIVFSNSGLDERKDIEKFLRANSGKKMHNVSAPGVNFLVVGPGELKRTPKLTVGVALGKWVVEDQWLIDSKEVGYFLDPDQYIPHDPTHEKAWSFSLRTAIARGRKGENNILKDHNIYITSSLLAQLKSSKQEESLVEMLKAAGASIITKKAPRGKKEDDMNGDKTLILGTEKGDADVSILEKSGWDVYDIGIVAVSVLRGRLEVDREEFRILVEKEGSQKAGRARKGK